MVINDIDSTKSVMQNVKQRFFALRNGLLADRLRASGCPFRIIFGLNLPQLREVAAAFGHDIVLAEALWDNVSTRESRLLAPMLVEVSVFGIEDARRWLAGLSGWSEEVDVLCHALLRHVDYRAQLIDELSCDVADAMRRYAALRLAFGLVSECPARCLELATAELERNEPLTRGVARQLAYEAEFVLSAGC